MINKSVKTTWMIEAERYIGMAEIPGPKTSAVITGWLHKLKAWWNDDETPWCGLFVAACIQSAGMELPNNWMRAKAWVDWGIVLAEPVTGCIVVFERHGGGHVGFVVGRTIEGNLLVLGGNQGNAVSIAPFSVERAIAYIWPSGVSIPLQNTNLPVFDAGGAQLSTNEA